MYQSRTRSCAKFGHLKDAAFTVPRRYNRFEMNGITRNRKWLVVHLHILIKFRITYHGEIKRCMYLIHLALFLHKLIYSCNSQLSFVSKVILTHRIWHFVLNFMIFTALTANLHKCDHI